MFVWHVPIQNSVTGGGGETLGVLIGVCCGQKKMKILVLCTDQLLFLSHVELGSAFESRASFSKAHNIQPNKHSIIFDAQHQPMKARNIFKSNAIMHFEL